MVGKHEIYLGNETIGQAAVTQQGLYYRIVCDCNISGKIIYRVLAKWTDKTENIGILAPVDGRFSLITRMPIKRAGEGQVTFRILPQHEKVQENFIPIRAEEPFTYLSSLENAYLRRVDDCVHMVIRGDSASSPLGNDPIP